MALAGIALGMLIVIGGALVWYFTGRESSLIMGSGLVMATGGGLREGVEALLSRLPTYNPYEAEELEPRPRRRRHVSSSPQPEDESV